MSITAKFQVSKDVCLPSLEHRFHSKPIASLLGPLHIDCDYRTKQGVLSDDDKEIMMWFESFAGQMPHDICLLTRSWTDQWDYEAGAYEQYVRDEQKIGSQKIDTPEQFAANCAAAENAWLDLNKLRKTIGDLISALEKVRPPNTWWYEGEYLLSDLWEAYRVLLGGLQQGYTRVRILCG